MAKISVLMPVRDAAPWIAGALRSVLRQSFRDFEVLVIDDGSSDGSQQIVGSQADGRVRLIQNGENMGVARTLNKGLDLACGEYVARMDADDECAERRFERQIEYMEANGDVGACGSWIRLRGRYEGFVLRRPSGRDCVRASLCLDNPLFHPTVMMRRATLEKHGLRYDDGYSRTEDFDLWSRMSVHAALDNLPQVLLTYRVHEKSVTREAAAVMEAQTLDILARELRRIGVEPSQEEAAFHREVGHGRRMKTLEDLDRAALWLEGLVRANDVSRCHDGEGMRRAAAFCWLAVCLNSGNLGPAVVGRHLRATRLRGEFRPTLREAARFVAAIALGGIGGLFGGARR